MVDIYSQLTLSKGDYSLTMWMGPIQSDDGLKNKNQGFLDEVKIMSQDCNIEIPPTEKRKN